MSKNKKQNNLFGIFLTKIARISMLGGMILTATSVSAIEVRTGANLDRGISRISVDLRDFVKREFKNDQVTSNCQGDLNNGQLVIKCDLSKFVEGGEVFPFEMQPSNPIDLK